MLRGGVFLPTTRRQFVVRSRLGAGRGHSRPPALQPSIRPIVSSFIPYAPVPPLANKPVNQYFTLMKTVGLFEAKTKLSEICSYVAEEGTPVVVTRRGKPIVRIEPVPEQALTIRERREAYLSRYAKQEKRDRTDFTTPIRSRDRPRSVPLD
jgi:prevent-host-death family protein